MEEKLKNCGSHRYAHQTVESTNCRADLIHVSNSEIYRSQGVADLDLLVTIMWCDNVYNVKSETCRFGLARNHNVMHFVWYNVKSETYRTTQWCSGLGLSRNQRGIHGTTKIPGSTSTVKSTGQYSGLDLRWDLQISKAKWIYNLLY